MHKKTYEYEQALEYVRSVTDFEPQIILTLGSGLGALADEVKPEVVLNYSDIPGFQLPTAPGHKGQLILGTLCNKSVAVMEGRVHMYEGYTPGQTVMPLRLLRMMGAKILFLTNAAGGINKDFEVGSLMMITDHISTFSDSPLRGNNDNNLGPRFPDMSEVYSKRLRQVIKSAAHDLEIPLKEGVYIQLPGPAFETPAEIRMCSTLGGDAVGMSTATEAMGAKHCGLEICGISLITNLASGITDKRLSGDDVNETAEKAAPLFRAVIKESIERM